MNSSVVVVGSLHYDLLVQGPRLPLLGETLPGTGWSYKCGGKGGNQAVEAARHGANVTMVACVGADGFGETLRHNLARAGVNLDHVTTVDGESGLSVVISEAKGDYAAVIISAANLKLSENHVAAASSTFSRQTVLVLQNEVPESANLAAARAVRKAGGRVILNAAPARDMTPELLSLVDVLVVNAIEAEMLGSGAVDDLKTACEAAEILGRQVPVAIVTAGGDGVAYWTEQTRGSLPPHRVKLISTHGAGDAFVGALAAKLATGASVPDAVTYANAAAAILVSTAEESRHLLTRTDLEALLPVV